MAEKKEMEGSKVVIGLAAAAAAGYVMMQLLKDPEGDTSPCPECGHPVPMKSDDCPHCGLELSWVSSESVARPE
jgi:endogenous inhibitor of DNA gyrase (YacG/DUF329 family)